MASECAGCYQKIPEAENLTCAHCKNTYDLKCANVSRHHFTKLMTLEHKTKWQCQACYCKTPKVGNINTPIRLQPHELAQQTNSPSEESNVTIRRRNTSTNNYTFNSEDLTILGDTLNTEEKETATQTELTLQNLSEIIMLRLKENNKSIITEIKNTIQSEINKAIGKLKADIEQKTDALKAQNELRMQEIGKVNQTIENLTKENEKLKEEILDIKNRKDTPTAICTETNTKKIVLYGFTEYYKEPDFDLHNRIIELFYSTMNVDLTGYIEETYRMGRYNNNNNRPLVIELISKSMTKYIISNGQYLQGTRLFISEFLDTNTRRERQLMREQMLQARRNGLFAIIRNNQLFIEGQKVNQKNETYNLVQNNNSKETLYNNNADRTCDLPTTNEDIRNHSFRKHRPTL